LRREERRLEQESGGPRNPSLVPYASMERLFTGLRRAKGRPKAKPLRGRLHPLPIVLVLIPDVEPPQNTFLYMANPK
jgi:hypothetical protein